MDNSSPIVPRTVTSEVAAATSLAPTADTSTYEKMCGVAIAMSEACEGIAKGDSDAALQAVERGLRGLDGVMGDYHLDLSEVLPSEICQTCGRLATDFRRRGEHVQCGACAHGSPTIVESGPVEVGVGRDVPDVPDHVAIRMPVPSGVVAVSMTPDMARTFAMSVVAAANALDGGAASFGVDIRPGFVRIVLEPLGLGGEMAAEDMEGFAERLGDAARKAAALRGAA